jgi:hypothetical protein
MNKIIALIGGVLMAYPIMAGEQLVWTDQWHNGWNRHYQVTEITSPTYKGSAKALSRTTPRIDGTVTTIIKDTPVLEFFVNLKVDATTPGYHFMRVDITFQDNSVVEFGTRGGGTIWQVEENGRMVTYHDVAVPFDTDPSTWQRVWVDLSQTYWYWDGQRETPGTANLTKAIKFIAISTYNSPSGSTLSYLSYYDNVRFITRDLMTLDSVGTVISIH